MKGKRLLYFFICILLGSVVGILYGWVVNPIAHADASPSQMREDFRSDYVLMVAEVYAKDGNIQTAVAQLNVLGNQPTLRYVQEAVLTARNLGYSQQDVDLLANLMEALQNWIPNPGNGGS